MTIIIAACQRVCFIWRPTSLVLLTVKSKHKGLRPTALSTNTRPWMEFPCPAGLFSKTQNIIHVSFQLGLACFHFTFPFSVFLFSPFFCWITYRVLPFMRASFPHYFYDRLSLLPVTRVFRVLNGHRRRAKWSPCSTLIHVYSRLGFAEHGPLPQEEAQDKY